MARLWLAANDTHPEGFDAEAADRLSDLAAQKHFWMRERQRLMARLLQRMSGGGPTSWQKALELGCGTGEQLRMLESVARTVTAVDGHRSLLEQAHARSSRAVLVQADVTDTALPSGEHDLIAAFDVIEHVDADAFLAEARRVARPGADLLLSAPAFPSLWSDMDVRAGHRCRYRLTQMRKELLRHGWRPAGHTHYQCLLFPLVYASRRWSGTAGQVAERRPSAMLDRWLGAVNRFEVQALGRCSLPFGSSLFVWAKAVAS
ncbi:class I SAM-dependent methyltransferase [Hydrogenophaga pseudoflava]|uniref:class I SAM-dependent methyltransferase n=1 Tax=Hydrogenophaga pseudoflava TaxID=47421 RepID=UPI0027E3DBFB|nr:class I SAM-dependent methyltransferase [Hydrogenophaga pseudoflava]MDQ7743547.1 class I SAM-dependent methyltransferase [Hydrogenophaga pseudoflava]